MRILHGTLTMFPIMLIGCKDIQDQDTERPNILIHNRR